MKNFLLVAGSLIFALLLFEGGLQAYGYFLETQRVSDLESESDIRILALGESTTDPLIAPEKKPWTYFLQKKIQDDFSGYKVTIINKGKAGMSTASIVDELQNWINEYRPHLIISMMGINDRQGFSFIHDKDLFSRLRTVRIIRWWLKSIDTKNNDEVKIQHPSVEERNKFKEILTKNFTLGSIAPEIENWMKMNPGLRWYALKETANLASLKMDSRLEYRKDFLLNKLAFELFEEALALNPTDNDIVTGVVYHGLGFEKRVVKALLNALDKGLQPDANLFNQIATENFYHDPDMEKIFGRIISLQGTRPIDQLKTHYIQMADTAREKSIDLAIMGYPTSKSEMYKLFFKPDYYFPGKILWKNLYLSHPETNLPSKYSEIIFIDNSSFPKNFDRSYYIDFFSDNPNLGFGHTTRKGHELIAENAYRTLSKEWLPKIRKILSEEP